MKKILIVREYRGFGGIEQQIVNTAICLKNSGWEVFFVTNVVSPLSESMASLREIHTEIFPFKNVLTTALKLREIVLKHRIPIIQAHMLRESYYCRLVKLLCPKVLHVYRVHTYIDCSKIASTKKSLYHLLGKLTDCFVSQYMSINYFNIKELVGRTHISPNKVTQVPDSIKLLSVEQAYLIPKENHIAMVANFVEGKGHCVLLEGLRIIKDLGLPIRASLFGAVPGMGTEYEDDSVLRLIKHRIKELSIEDMVEFRGFSSNIAVALSDVSIVVLPSDAEGTPNVLLEAMYLRKVVVASDVGGIPELIENNATGFLHQRRSAIDFANALVRAINLSAEDRERIENAAYSEVVHKYSMQAMCSGISDALSRLHIREK